MIQPQRFICSILKSSNLRAKKQNLMILRKNSKLVQPLMDNDYSHVKDRHKIKAPEHFRHVFPDLLPNPHFEWRNHLRERIEREDMIARRNIIEIPEFYVGSILAVTVSDPNATSKLNRFVGICILRGGHGMYSWFTLRNVVENIGVEILYEIYCPLIQSIEVIRCEKRLDEDLTYLRDSLLEYSKFDFNMDPEPLLENAPVPLNPLKVKLKPLPWRQRWERIKPAGVEEINVNFKRLNYAKREEKPWEKYDLMKEYRATITEEEQDRIYGEILPHMPKFESVRRRMKRVKMKAAK